MGAFDGKIEVIPQILKEALQITSIPSFTVMTEMSLFRYVSESRLGGGIRVSVHKTLKKDSISLDISI